ncbi:MAG: glycosyl hydrolase [Ignavibacteriales bacterium]|nr:glycosyl hydrolase [Ignavibacteriales bacterium]
MKTILLSILLSIAFLILSSSRVQAQQKFEHLFYYVDSEMSFKSFTENIEKISIVAPQAYSVDEDGIVWGSIDPRVLDLAAKQRVGVMPLIVNPGFDQTMLHKLLVNEQARQRAIASMVELCERNKFLGIQFDLENLHINDKDAFTQFYRETADALHKKRFLLSAAVVHRPDELAGPTWYFKWLFENWRAGYDLRELAKIGDFLSVMTYSQHTRRTTPGPNAGIPWVTQVIEYFLKFMPPEKLSLGIPLGSQHWYTLLDTARFYVNARSWSSSVDFRSAMMLIDRFKANIQWNDEQKVPYAIFDNGGLFEYIYMEDSRSFKAKYELISKYKLRGFSAWATGNEHPEIWKAMPTPR